MSFFFLASSSFCCWTMVACSGVKKSECIFGVDEMVLDSFCVFVMWMLLCVVWCVVVLESRMVRCGRDVQPKGRWDLGEFTNH